MLRYVSIDLETTGLEPNEGDQILQIAAVVDGGGLEGTPVEQLPTFNRVIHRTRVYGHPVAMAMNAELLKKCAAEPAGNDEQAVFIDFECWLQQYLDGNKIVGAGKNFGSFDLSFLRRAMDTKVFHHRYLDPGMLYFDAKSDVRTPPNSEACINRLMDDYPHAGVWPVITHDALEDAQVMVRLIRHKCGGRVF